MDYRKFLAKEETMVLPYLGGSRVEAEGRRLRVTGSRPRQGGWYSFRVEGRNATALDAASAPSLEALPAVRGHLVGRYLFGDGAGVSHVQMLPEDEPLPLSPVVARRWHSGDLLLDSVEFESDVEPQVRVALEERRSIEAVRGVSPSLRMAFGYALCAAIGRETNVLVSPVEVLGQLVGFASQGPRAVREALGKIAQERLLARALRDRPAELPVRPARAAGAFPIAEARPVAEAMPYVEARPAFEARPAPRPVQSGDVWVEHGRRRGSPRNQGRATLDNAADRAESALDAAGAQMRSARLLSGGQLEVAYRFRGERFITVVDALTLQVVDAGICLAGADRHATLDSMPSIIKEAIDTGKLVITRH